MTSRAKLEVTMQERKVTNSTEKPSEHSTIAAVNKIPKWVASSNARNKIGASSRRVRWVRRVWSVWLLWLLLLMLGRRIILHRLLRRLSAGVKGLRDVRGVRLERWLLILRLGRQMDR